MGDCTFPLVTLYVLCYNRREYIRASLESAFAQDYSSLEIVISDNGSTDGTFDIVCDMVRQYRGRHEVVVNRNDENLGLIGNVRKAFSLAHGELLVMQCDDDVSVPNRVSVMVREWMRHEKKPFVVCSSYQYMTRGGDLCSGQGYFWSETGIEPRSLEDVLLHYSYRGSSAGYRPEVMSMFGEIHESKCYDDMVLFSRGRMLGDILLVKDCLLHYREGGLSSNTGSVEDAFVKIAVAERSSYQQLKLDVDCACKTGLLSDARRCGLQEICDHVISNADARINMLKGNFQARCIAYKHLRRNPGGQRKVVLLCVCVLPRRVTRWLVSLFFGIQKMRGKVL